MYVPLLIALLLLFAVNFMLVYNQFQYIRYIYICNCKLCMSMDQDRDMNNHIYRQYRQIALAFY